MSNEERFDSMFPSWHEAFHFAESVLQCGQEFLPACAIAVLEGDEPTEAYYEFMIQQAQEASR